MIIIKDINGKKLRLGKTRLSELVGCVIDSETWGVDLDKVKEAIQSKNSDILCTLPAQNSRTRKERRTHLRFRTKADYDVVGPTIGCRTFTPATFAKILKAAGVKTKKLATRKKGKK